MRLPVPKVVKPIVMTMMAWLWVSYGWLVIADDGALDGQRHRVLVSTDIGGTDPDDFQSMVHLLVYADLFDLEGLISSPFGPGRKSDLLSVIEHYERDYKNLRSYSEKYPTADALRAITKQGETEEANSTGVGKSTEGSQWIIQCAKRDDPRPLHILVWGGLEDLAQALHDAPEILPKLQVYWIGGPNKKWSVNAYNYIEQNHSKLWMIEANATYRGWFVGGNQQGQWGNQEFVTKHIAGHGALGDYFSTQLKGTIKMGDTPSVARLLKGDSDHPDKPSWGGQYVRIWEDRKTIFNRLTSEADQAEAFGVVEFVLRKPDGYSSKNSAAMTFNGGLPKSIGVIEGDVLRFRFSPRDAKVWSYVIESDFAKLNGQTGKFDAVPPLIDRTQRASTAHPNWWIDDPDPAAAEGVHPGAKSVNRWREDFLGDFAKRMDRCQSAKSQAIGLLRKVHTVEHFVGYANTESTARTRVIITTDAEIDDQCSFVRFLLYANEWDIEGIITTSSQYHWRGKKWAGDDWAQVYLDAYAAVHPNLMKHDPRFPTVDYLRDRMRLGNVKAEGEMTEITPGSQLIVQVLLDESDDRPVWIQAWGGVNTIARALKTIEDSHPDKMESVARKLRFFFIWEQDSTYQDYIKPRWGKFKIPTVISDQFIAIFYHWKRYLPQEQQRFLVGSWMRQNVLENHGPLCALYKSHVDGDRGFDKGDFRSEGDSPAFLHTIPNGLRSLESPDWGGWGGRYVHVRDNTWLDPVGDPGYRYPEGRWHAETAWGRSRFRQAIPDDAELTEYLRPLWRWIEAMQNDFASRADWCVATKNEANHPPQVVLANSINIKLRAGTSIDLDAGGSIDPDGNNLKFHWWHYPDPGTYRGSLDIYRETSARAAITAPADARQETTAHIICEVTDSGTPPLTRYQRIIVEFE